jgi:hypothetical protein
MTTRAALLIAILVFVITVLVRLPARTLLPLLPPQVSCETPSGTVWHGACAQLRSGTVSLSGFTWHVQPAQLLRGGLQAELVSTDPKASGQAIVTLSAHQQVDVHQLTAQLPLRNGLSVLPHDLSGTVQVSVDRAQLRHGQLLALQGFVRVLQLRSESQAADLGSFELRFPPAAPGDPIQGQLQDLGGPLSVSGQLRLMRSGGYDLSGWVVARPSASPELVQALQLLGPADAQGRRMFSVAGSL